ncbi:unnamed protein product [Mytilus edulis]|uniref:NWD1/2-like winged helix-turn-helix domain-containing protein n=1 Tax=Mytilus edulis TaxID=6550 RepID=A0A8S3TDK6_MYTED|nr:unnamed protein product [Mytilus edulis]
MNGLAIEDGPVNPFRLRHLDDVIDQDETDEVRREMEVPLRYKDLMDTERSHTKQILFGGILAEDIPHIRSKEIKIYICSAGTDSEVERDAFVEDVYPALRDYCKETHGLDFHAIDMRWGIDYSENGWPSTETCLKELQHCQTHSLGPCIVAILGQKYKRFTPPETIEEEEFELLKESLMEEENIALLDVIYEKDTNINPAVYRLQRPSTDKDPSLKMWKDTQKTVQEILEDAARTCLESNKISKEKFLKYTSSEIHQEIQQGILNQSDRDDKCLFFSRLVSNMDDLLTSSKRPKFLDILPCNNEQDINAEIAANSLRKEVLGNLDSNNSRENFVDFSTNGIHYKNVDEYTQNVCRYLHNSVKKLIDYAVKNQNTLHSDNLYREVVQHWHASINSSQPFVGRDNILSKVKEYLLSETDQPLVITGVSGSGKSSIIAKIASDVNIAIKNEDLAMRTALVFRFVGQTQNAVTAQELLYSLCNQLAFVMGKYRHDVPKDFKALKLYFIEMVQRGEFGGMLIILIDSLDMLSTFENGHKLEWLPSRVAVNVKIVVSVNSECKECLTRLVHKCPDNIVDIIPLSNTDCENVMKVMMNKERRSVSYDQWKLVQNAFQNCTLPLFVKIVFDEVSLWHSYDDSETQVLGNSVNDVIDNIFHRAEIKFGKHILSGVLGYLTASRDGLSESELVDILSSDEDNLNHVFCTWHPKVRRYPAYLVSVIRQYFEPYLLEKECDSIRVLCWKYPCFKIVAHGRYVRNDEEKLHSTIADYFLGKWGGFTRKPCTYPSRLTAKKKMITSDDKACRLLPVQHNFYGESEVRGLYNKRKMTELPFSLMCSGRHGDLRSETFCNFHYIYYRLKASSLEHLLADFDMFHDRETTLVADALRMSGAALQADVDSLGVELTGRLLPHSRRFNYIRELIYQCDLAAQAHCPLVPNCQIYSAPGGPLQYECDVGGNVFCPIDIDVFNSPDGILLTAKPHFSSRVRVWELSRGDSRPDMMMPLGEIHPTRDGRFLNIIQNDQMIKIYRSDCGELHGEIVYGHGRVSDIEVSNKYITFCVEKGTGPYIIDVDAKSVLHRFSFHAHAVAVSPDENYVAFNSEKNILLYQMPLMERKCMAQASDVPQDIIFSNNKPKCFIFTKSKIVESIEFDVVSRKFTCKFIFSDLELRQCVISNTQKYLLCRSAKCLHLVYTHDNKLLRKFDKLPEDVIVEQSSNFTGAEFTPEDKYIVASRYTFLAVWDTVTGNPLRVLQSSVSPILRVYTSNAVNKVVSLLADNSFQVWNLENIDSNILHSNNIFPGNVFGAQLSTVSQKIVAFEGRVPEAKVLSLRNGQVTDILQHSHNTDDKVRQVILSPNGRFAVTRGQRAEDMTEGSTVWRVLRDDVVWDLEASKRTHYSGNNRFVNFTKDSEYAVFISLVNYSRYDWSDNTYALSVVQAENGITRTVPFPPCTEFVSPPCIVLCGSTNYFTAIVQICNKTHDPKSKKERSRHYEVQLLLEDISGTEEETTFLKIQNVLEEAEEDCQFIDVKTNLKNQLVLMYAKGLDQYVFEMEKGLVRPSYIQKGLIVYDFKNKGILKHIPEFLSPSSDINNLTLSRNSMIVMDQNRSVFNVVNPKSVIPIDKQFGIGTPRFVLDGRFIVGLTPNFREVIVVRTCDGIVKGHMFVHGCATCVSVGADDRTVVVGCEDGRVMILTIILELCDPVREIIQSFPSRQIKPEKEPDSMRLIKKDIRHMMCRTPDHARLSARLQTSAIEENRRPPSHRIISTGVSMTQNIKRSRSEVCSVQ